MVVLWMSLPVFLSIYLCEGEIVNLALHKPVNSSGIFHNYIPQNAVDGNKHAVEPNIMHTASGRAFAWWWVDLETPVQDATVKIYFRIDNVDRRNGVQLYTSSEPFSTYPEGTLCHTVSGSDLPAIVNVTCNGTWSHLMIYTNTSNGGDKSVMLDFAEVEVLGCNRTYGETCDKSCSSRQCAVEALSCDRYTGTCPPGGCKAGWTGTDCIKACPRSTHGVNCSENCGHCNGTCDVVDGHCPEGCMAGYCGIQCQIAIQTGSDYLIGGSIGASVMMVVAVAVFTCLLRCRRLQWVTSSTTEDSRMAAQMVDISIPVISHGVSEGSRPCSAHNNLYTTLDVETQSHSNDYGVIENVYRNV